MAERVAFSPSLALGASALRSAPVCHAPVRATFSAAHAPRMAFTSIGGVLTDAPVSLPCDVNLAIAAVYKQVLGNAHVMESERAEWTNAESEFRRGGDVREFVRAVAKSDGYRARFFDGVSAFRCTELLFKHLLGRGARSKAEYGATMGVMQQKGYDVCVDRIVDSDEYEEIFGSDTVPYGVYRGLYPTNEEFNRAVAMRGTPCSSDKARSAVLLGAVCSGDSPSWLTISKNLPSGTEKGTGFQAVGRWASGLRNKKGTVRVGTKIPGGVVFYD